MVSRGSVLSEGKTSAKVLGHKAAGLLGPGSTSFKRLLLAF
jgi:hypothetical protein